MNPMSEAISDWARTHRNTLLSAKVAIQTGNYSMAIEFLEAGLKIMDTMIEELKKI